MATTFDRAVADAFRDIKEGFQGKDIDRSVKEEVNKDIDRIIDHHENRKPWPITNGVA